MNIISKVTISVALVLSASITVTANGSVNYSRLNDWTGFYAGADAGFNFNDAELKSHHVGFTNPNETCNSHKDFSTAFHGIQAGYMQQFPSEVVSGVEASISFNNKTKEKSHCNSIFGFNVYDGFTFKNQMQGSIKARMGRVFPWDKKIFLYVTPGISLVDTRLIYTNEGGDYYSKNVIKAGWLVGTGIEWAFRPNWSLRLEYNYIDYTPIKMSVSSVYGLVDANGRARLNLTSNTFALAINYWV